MNNQIFQFLWIILNFSPLASSGSVLLRDHRVMFDVGFVEDLALYPKLVSTRRKRSLLNVAQCFVKRFFSNCRQHLLPVWSGSRLDNLSFRPVRTSGFPQRPHCIRDRHTWKRGDRGTSCKVSHRKMSLNFKLYAWKSWLTVDFWRCYTSICLLNFSGRWASVCHLQYGQNGPFGGGFEAPSQRRKVSRGSFWPIRRERFSANWLEYTGYERTQWPTIGRFQRYLFGEKIDHHL